MSVLGPPPRFLAALNKCLAKSNKSGTWRKTTKKRNRSSGEAILNVLA